MSYLLAPIYDQCRLGMRTVHPSVVLFILQYIHVGLYADIPLIWNTETHVDVPESLAVTLPFFLQDASVSYRSGCSTVSLIHPDTSRVQCLNTEQNI